MVYCTKCGKKNDDESEFCSKCGKSLIDKKINREKEFDKRCEEECAGGKQGTPIFWGILVILIGLWIIFEFVLKNIKGLPTEFSWIYDFEFFWIFALLIAIAIIITGFRILTRR